MAIPRAHTTCYRLLMALAPYRAFTVARIAADPAVLPEVKGDRAERLDAFCSTLIGEGCLTVDQDTYRLTRLARRHCDVLAGLPVPSGTAPDAPLVPPRRINVFGAPLSPRYVVSPLGTREGSNDHKRYASIG